MNRTVRYFVSVVALGLFLPAQVSAETKAKVKPTAPEAVQKPAAPATMQKPPAPATVQKSAPPAAVKGRAPAQSLKIAPFRAILNKRIPSFERTKNTGKTLMRRDGALDPRQLQKIIRNPRFGDRIRLPRPWDPATPDCSCSVAMSLSMSRPDNVFFTDDALTASYSINCATGATIGEMEYTDYRAALAAAEGGYAIDSGGGGAYYTSDNPRWAEIIAGSRSMTGSPPGVYHWMIGANNTLNGSNCSQTLAFQLIDRPGTGPACADYDDCIAAMARYIKPRISAGITNNAALDAEVEAFRDGVYDRRVIGLRLEQDILSTSNITCTTCGDGSSYNGGLITLDFCPSEYYPTDYAFLHELVHRAGFDERLIAAYTARGLAAPTRGQVEGMAVQVAGAAFDRSRICSEY